MTTHRKRSLQKCFELVSDCKCQSAEVETYLQVIDAVMELKIDLAKSEPDLTIVRDVITAASCAELTPSICDAARGSK